MLNDCPIVGNAPHTPFMLKTLLPYMIAFGVTLIGAVATRLAAGLEHGTRLAGLFIGVGGMGALFAIPGFEWTAAGPLNRTGHILIGALLVGTAFDVLKAPRVWKIILLGLFALGCGWASANNTLILKTAPSMGQLGLALALALVWAGMILRFSAQTAHKATNLVVLIAALSGLALLALIVGDRPVTFIALSFVAALFAFALCSIVLNLDLGDGAKIPVVSSLVAIAWALSQRHPEALWGLGVLTLVLFAERTARRVPMPQGGIAAYLYLVVLAGFCAIPIFIAAVLVSAAASP